MIWERFRPPQWTKACKLNMGSQRRLGRAWRNRTSISTAFRCNNRYLAKTPYSLVRNQLDCWGTECIFIYKGCQLWQEFSGDSESTKEYLCHQNAESCKVANFLFYSATNCYASNPWQYIIVENVLESCSKRQYFPKEQQMLGITWILDFNSISPNSLGLWGCLSEDFSSGASI